MKQLLTWRVAAVGIALLTGPYGTAFGQDSNHISWMQTWEISNQFKSDVIKLTASARFAGAINSLTWRGAEFIDSADHGRELQSALHLDGLGECYNPTEAGSASDWITSSSKLLSVSVEPNKFTSRVRMAFWLKPGSSSPSCPRAKNTVALSDHELTKTVTISGNVIVHDVTFRVPRHYNSAVFEALTAYLPEQFNTFWVYDVRSQMLKPLSDGPGEQPAPVIIATQDQKFALGVYSPSLPQIQRPNSGYGRWKFEQQRVNKWNCVFRLKNVQPGAYAYRCYTIIGSLEDVRLAMRRLARSSDRFHERGRAGWRPRPLSFPQHASIAGSGVHLDRGHRNP